MELQNLSRPELAIVCKLFGALFYYPPRDFNQFPFGTYFEEDEVETPIKEVNQVLNSFKFTKQSTLQDEHDRLFTIQDDMPAHLGHRCILIKSRSYLVIHIKNIVSLLSTAVWVFVKM